MDGSSMRVAGEFGRRARVRESFWGMLVSGSLALFSSAGALAVRSLTRLPRPI
jgi:hypothetical protein